MVRTNAFGILVVLLRTGAVWLFCKTVLSLPGFLATAAQYEAKWTLLAVLVPFGIALVMWAFADRIAQLAMVRPNQPVFESDLPAAEWQALAFAVVGLWQAVLGLLDLFYFAMRWLIGRRVMEEVGAEWPADEVAMVLAAGLQLAVGLGLMLGGRGVVALLRRWRFAGSTAPGG